MKKGPFYMLSNVIPWNLMERPIWSIREDLLFIKCTYKVNTKVSLCDVHRWVDFSPLTYTHWSPGEPNNANGEEQCVQMNRLQGKKLN